MRSLVGLLGLLFLGGCAATVPAISDIRSDVVKVQARANFWYQFPDRCGDESGSPAWLWRVWQRRFTRALGAMC